MHCIAAMPRGGLVERYDADFDQNPLHEAIMANAAGSIPVPQGPGLGVDPDQKVIDKFRTG